MKGTLPKTTGWVWGWIFPVFLLVFLFSSEAAVSCSGVYASKDGEDGIPESSKESPESVFAFRS